MKQIRHMPTLLTAGFAALLGAAATASGQIAPMVHDVGVHGLGAGSRATPAAARLQPLNCRIETRERQHGVTLAAVVRSNTANLSGSYAFRIEHRSGSNASTSMQGGEFTLSPGENETVGEVAIGGRLRDVDAVLLVTGSGGSTFCETLIRSGRQVP